MKFNLLKSKTTWANRKSDVGKKETEKMVNPETGAGITITSWCDKKTNI